MTDGGLASQGLAILLGGVAGGIVSGAIVGATWFLDKRSQMLRDFLNQGLAIHALREAWILEQHGSQTATLANYPNLPTRRPEVPSPWLRQVEVRAVLDQGMWNSPEASGKAAFYGIIEGRRVWIVRSNVQPQRSFAAKDIDPKQSTYPSLLSSQAMHELCGWIERVASVKGIFLGNHAYRALFHLLAPVSGDDRVAVFGDRLTTEAIDFLRRYHEKYAKA